MGLPLTVVMIVHPNVSSMLSLEKHDTCQLLWHVP